MGYVPFVRSVFWYPQQVKVSPEVQGLSSSWSSPEFLIVELDPSGLGLLSCKLPPSCD